MRGQSRSLEGARWRCTTLDNLTSKLDCSHLAWCQHAVLRVSGLDIAFLSGSILDAIALALATRGRVEAAARSEGCKVHALHLSTIRPLATR